MDLIYSESADGPAETVADMAAFLARCSSRHAAKRLARATQALARFGKAALATTWFGRRLDAQHAAIRHEIDLFKAAIAREEKRFAELDRERHGIGFHIQMPTRLPPCAAPIANGQADAGAPLSTTQAPAHRRKGKPQ